MNKWNGTGNIWLKIASEDGSYPSNGWNLLAAISVERPHRLSDRTFYEELAKNLRANFISWFAPIPTPTSRMPPPAVFLTPKDPAAQLDHLIQNPGVASRLAQAPQEGPLNHTQPSNTLVSGRRGCSGYQIAGSPVCNSYSHSRPSNLSLQLLQIHFYLGGAHN